MSTSSSRKGRGRSSSPYGVVSTVHYESGPPASKVKLSEEDPDIMEVVKEEEWEERRKKTTTTTKNIERRVQRQLILEDGQIVNDTGPVVSEDTTEDTVVKEDVSNENAHPEGQPALDPPPGEGWMSTPGAIVISEKSTKTTKSHDEVQDELETEEVQHCGDVTNQEAEDHIKGKSDLRELISQRESQGLSVLQPRKRVVHESTRKKGHSDTTDVKEFSKIQDGHVVTETSRTVKKEQYDNESLPDSGSSLSDGSVHEAKKETSHNIVHIKDEDLLEYYAVPKGGTLAQGVKIGEGMHVVSEDVQEDRQGNDKEGEEVENLRKTRKPSRRDALTKKLLNYDQEEHTRKRETDKWLESHFGSESGRSEDSAQDADDSSSRNKKSGGNRITITMSPYPASKEDTQDSPISPTGRNWQRERILGSSFTQKQAPPPPPPKPANYWSSPIASPKSPTVNSTTKQVYNFQNNEIANARSRLRSTGLKLTDENKENDEPDNFSKTKVHHIPTDIAPGTYYSKTITTTRDSMKDDVINKSKYRSGTPMKSDLLADKEKYGNHNIVSSTVRNYIPSYSPPSLSNVGRSQSFHIQTLPLSSKNHVENKFRLSRKDYRSEERLDDFHYPRNSSYQPSSYHDERHNNKDYNIRRDNSYHSEERSSWKSKPLWSSPREGTPPKKNNRRSYIEKDYSFSSNSGIEAGTQTGPSPVPPPRSKRKKRPQSSYFFGEENGDCYSNSLLSHSNNRHSFYDSSPSYNNRYSNDSKYRYTSDHQISSRHSPKLSNSERNQKDKERSSRYESQYNNKNRNYSYSDNKNSWTSTVDPRRRPRHTSDEERSVTLPRKVSPSKNHVSFPSKTYIFGENETPYNSPSENSHSYREKSKIIHHIPINRSESHAYEYKSSKWTNGNNKISKPVGRSQSFNVEASRRFPSTNGFSRPLSEISRQKNSSLYSSSPYVNLSSPYLIANITRTSSSRCPDNDRVDGTKNNSNGATKEKKDRFMKGLLNNAPELYHFIHGSGDKGDHSLKNHLNGSSPSGFRTPNSDSPNYSPPSSAKSPTYTAPIFTFGKRESNTTLNRSTPQRSIITNEEEQRKNHYNNVSNISIENGYNSTKSYGNLDSPNRRTKFNLKTAGSSLLYSPSFRDERESSLERKYRYKHTYNDNGKSGDLSRQSVSSGLASESPVLIQVRDWNTR